MTEAYQELDQAYLEALEDLGRRFAFMFRHGEDESYTMQLEMPGELLWFAGQGVINDHPEWKVDNESFWVEDCLIAARSRVLNLWAVIVSGIFVLLVTVGLVRWGFLRLRK